MGPDGGFTMALLGALVGFLFGATANVVTTLRSRADRFEEDFRFLLDYAEVLSRTLASAPERTAVAPVHEFIGCPRRFLRIAAVDTLYAACQRLHLQWRAGCFATDRSSSQHVRDARAELDALRERAAASVRNTP